MVDVIKTGFSAEWMPAGEMEGRRARCLATAKKSAFPAVIPIREKMIHIERRTPEADDHQYRCFRGSVCFEVSCAFSGGRGKENDHAHIFIERRGWFASSAGRKFLDGTFHITQYRRILRISFVLFKTADQ